MVESIALMPIRASHKDQLLWTPSDRHLEIAHQEVHKPFHIASDQFY